MGVYTPMHTHFDPIPYETSIWLIKNVMDL